jgi:hypothetical protein
MKGDIVALINILKPVIMSILELLQTGKTLSPLDEFVLSSSRQLLRLLYEFFGQNDYID